MINDDLSAMNIERFAAFLDGNLSQEEIQDVTQMISSDEKLRELYNVNKDVDDTIASYKECDLELPEEIMDMDFSVPDVSAGTSNSLLTLEQKFPFYDSESDLGVCACQEDTVTGIYEGGEDTGISCSHDYDCMDNDNLTDSEDFTID